MSLAKQKRDKDRKKELAAIRKQKCVDAHEALVQLLIPPTTHQDLAKTMPERELRALSHSQLAAQAARLMTTEDPLGMLACNGIAIDQCIMELGANTTQKQSELIQTILVNKGDELNAIDAVNKYCLENPVDDEGYDGTDDGGYDGYDGNDDDQNSVPGDSNDAGGSNNDDGDSENDSEDEDIITVSNASSSSRLPAALSTVGVETRVGKAVVRTLGKRTSVNTAKFGKFHGLKSQPVLDNISNPVLSQSRSKKPRRGGAESSQGMQFPSDQHSGTADVPSTSASTAPVPSNAQGVAADVLSADALPSSGAEDDNSSAGDEDDNEDDNDGTRLLFGNSIFDDTQDDDAPVNEPLPDPVEGSTAAVNGSAGVIITQEVPLTDALLPDKLHQRPEIEVVGGQNVDLVLQCFTAAPELQLHRYREPGTDSASDVGPLPLQQVVVPAAAVPLAQHADDHKLLSHRYRNSSFGQQITMLHHTWNVMHPCVALPQMRFWLEHMPSSGHIILVWARAAYLNCLPEYLSTFGEAKSAFWDMANAFGDFSSGSFEVKFDVALAAVTVPYFLVRSLRAWLQFCHKKSIDIKDIWQINDEQEFAALGVTVFPSLHLCMAMLILLVNFCSSAYRNAFTIEILLQRQVFPCRAQHHSGLTLTAIDANLAVQSYFPDELQATDINDSTGLNLLNRAVAWAKHSLSAAAIRADINDLWLQLLSLVFRPLLPIRQLTQVQQEAVLLTINPLLFTNSELRQIYPMLIKGSAERLLEYLNNNPMAGLLYGRSMVTDTYGGLCIKLLGCLVATLQELHGVVNVDAWLSVTDITFLMNKGGVLAPTASHRVFESKVFYVLSSSTMHSKFSELMGSGLPMPIVSAPRTFVKLTTPRSWSDYYNRQCTSGNLASLAQRALQIALEPIIVSPPYSRSVARFEISKQSKAIVDPAAPTDCVRTLARKVRRCLMQSDPPSAPMHVNPAVQAAAASVLVATVPSAAPSSGPPGSALVNLLPPVRASTAIYGSISARRRDPLAGYVSPDMLAIAAQQQIVGWHTMVDFIFDAEGTAYMHSLALWTMQQRPPAIGDNFVFLYDPDNQFTPSNPFPSICSITHLWYRLTAVENNWYYFDFQGLLCNWVSSTIIPLQIKLQYRGTYLLYTPPIPGSSTLPNNQQPSLLSSGTAPQVPTVQAVMHSHNSGTTSGGVSTQSAGASPISGYSFGTVLANPLPSFPSVALQVPAPNATVAPQPAPVTPAAPATATGYASDDSEEQKMVKVVKLRYGGDDFEVLGKESVIKILRETQSVRTLMEDGQLELLVRHDGNYVNNYTKEVFRAGILRQHSLATVHTGMTLLVSENHDLLRFKSLVCFDVPELQQSLYTLKHDFPYLQTSTSLHSVHYLTKADASSCNYDIRTYDMWVKTWEGYKLAFKLILGPTYGLALASIITDIQQHNVGQLFDVDYLLALQATLFALIFNYSSSSDEFVIGTGTQRFQPKTMSSGDWQTVISMLWTAFKAQLTYGVQQEVNMTRARYNQTKCKPIQFKSVKPAGVLDVPPKGKVAGAGVQPKKVKTPPAKAGVKKVEFAAADINICISDISRYYKVTTTLEKCAADCKYVHYDQLPSTMTKAILAAKVQKLAEKCNLTDSQVKFFISRVNADKKLK